MRIELPELQPASLHEALRQFARRASALHQLESSGVMTSQRCLTELADLWSSLRETALDLGVSEWIIDEYESH